MSARRPGGGSGTAREIALHAAGFVELFAVEGEIEESARLWLRIADDQSDVVLREPIAAL